MAPLREALRASDPTDFWVTAAPLASLVEDPGDLADALPEGVDLLQTLIETDIAETTALLHVMGALSRNDLTRQRVRRALETRRQPVPPHVSGLSQAVVTGTQVFSDSVGDNHLLELTLPGEVRATLAVFVTRVPHLYLKDAFVLGERLDRVLEQYEQAMTTDGFALGPVLRSVDPAETRASLEDALAGIRPEVSKGPEPGDQWPMIRPFLEFVLSLLPEAGRGYDSHGFLPSHDRKAVLGGAASPGDWFWDEADGVRGEDVELPWVDEDGINLVQEFLSSRHAEGLPQDGMTGAVVAYLMSMAQAQEGDPKHWCTAVVGWLLAEGLPMDPIVPEEAVDRVPTVLPALVGWAHDVTEFDPEESETVRQVMTPLLAELLDRRADPRLRVSRLDMRVLVAIENGELDVMHHAMLAQRVGGDDELEALHADPLPDEPIDLAAVPEDVASRLLEVDAELVRGLANLADSTLPLDEPVTGVEFRTACRRFLVQSVVGNPEVLRRRASAARTAAAVAWIVGRGNDFVGQSPAPVGTGELMRAFDVKGTPSSRADTLMTAALLPDAVFGIALGSPHLLVSSARAAIIRKRAELSPLESDQF